MESRPAAKAGGAAAAAKLNKLRFQRAAQAAQHNKGVLVAVNSNKEGRVPGGQWATESGREQEKESLRSALAEKDEIIKGLRSRLSIAQQQAQRPVAVVGEPPAAIADGQYRSADRRVEAQNAQLEGANLQLRQRLQETLLELHTAHEQLRILRQLQQELEEGVPEANMMVETALAQERVLQEARNERVLQMLKSKDEVIQSFEARYTEAQSEIASYKTQLHAALQQLDNSQLRVCELVEARSKLRQQLEEQEMAAAQAAAGAKAEIVQLQEEAVALRQRDAERCLLHDRIVAQQSDMAVAHAEVEKLSEAVEAANVVIQELQSVVQEKDVQLSQQEQALQQHQEHVARLLGVPLADAPALTAAAMPAKLQPADNAQRIAELEAANERLEQALVAANAGGGGSHGSQARGEDEDAVTQLSIQLAERQGQLEAAREQVQELEALQHLARETALQTEGKLVESLRQAAACQQRCDELQQRAEEAEGVASQLNARVSKLVLAEQASRAELHSTQEALEQLQQEHSKVERARAEEGHAHARDVERLEAQLAAAKDELAACQASREELERQAGALQQQVQALQQQMEEMQQQAERKEQAPARLGFDLGSSTFASSVLAAQGTANPSSVSAPLAAIEDLAVLPNDKLLQLVTALQLDVKTLQAQLDGARSEAAAAQQRALIAERAVQGGAHRHGATLLEDISASLSARRQASMAAASSEGAAKAAQLRQQHAEDMLRVAQAEAAKAKADLASRCKALQQQLDATEAECVRAVSERGAAQAAAAAAEQAAEERKAQLAVVMQTLEVLQPGSSPDAKREHVLAMTGELAAARQREVALQYQVSALEEELGAAREQVLSSKQRLAAALESGKAAQQSQAEAEAAAKVYREDIADMRAKLLEQQELATKMQAELSEARQAAAASKAAAAGLQAALRQAQDRHLAQLARERGEAAAAARSAHLLRLQSGLQPTTPEPHTALLAPLQEGLAQLKAAAESDKEGLAAEVTTAMTKNIQEMLLRIQHVETEGHALEAELHAAREQCRSAEAALEARTSEWQAALAEKEALQHQAAQAENVSATAAAQQQRLQLERNVVLSEQLSECRVQLAQMEAALQQAEGECSKYKAESLELLAKLAVAEANLTCPPAFPASFTSCPVGAGGAGEQPVADMLAAAHRRADALAEQNAGLKAALQDLQCRLGSLATSIQVPTPSHHINELERQLQQAQQQLSALHDQLQQREAQMLAHSAEAERLEVSAALLEAQLVEAQQRAAKAEQRAREELSGASLQECEALARQTAQVREEAERAVREAQQKALQEVQAAQGRVEELEAQLLAERKERDSLHSIVAQLEAQLAETCATLDAKAAALSLVQGSRVPFGGSPGAAPGSPGSKQRAGATSVAALSQHLLESNLAHVEATKQLRVAEKLNQSLKKQLAHAEHRATQLKDALQAKAAAHKALVEQTQLLLTQRLGPAGASAESSSAGLPALFSELLPAGAEASGASGSALGGSPAAAGLPPAAQSSPGAPYLQMELAKRELEVERLQAALDKAIDAQRGQAECFAMLTAQAQQKEQEQQQVIERLQQYATAAASQASTADRGHAAEEAALPPLECSQRAVIRSLTVQLADLRRQLAQLCFERDQLRERLRVLRGSLGSGRAVDLQASIDLQGVVDDPAFDTPFGDMPGKTSGGSSGTAPQPPFSAPEAQADHAEGLFVLLSKHVKALARAEQQLAAIQQQQQQSPKHGNGELESSSPAEAWPRPSASGLLPQLAHAAAMLAAELPAMEATIQVLQTEVMWLFASQRGTEGTAADPSKSPPLCLPSSLDTSSLEAGAAQDNLLPGDVESKLLRTRQRKDKWKRRCLEAEAQLQAAQTAAEEAKAAVQERVMALEQAHAELVARQSDVAVQLQAAEAAAAHAEADKAQLEQALQCCTQELRDAAALAETLHWEVQAQRGEAERVQEELEKAQNLLDQEHQEHAQLVASLRAMIAGLQSSGGAESELRSQLIQLAEKVAVLTAAQEAARLEVEQKQSALAGLQQELEALRATYAALEAEKEGADEALAGMRQEYRALWQLLEAAETRLHQVEGTLFARCEALSSQLEQSSRHRDPPGITDMVAGLSGLQAAAEDLQDRYERLEAQAAVLIQQKHAAAVAQWARLTRSQRYRSAVQALRDGLQHDLLEAQAICQAQAEQLAQVQELAMASQQECSELVARLQEAHAVHQSELQSLAQQHAVEVAAFEQEWAAARLDLQRQAELMAKAAATAAEQHAKADCAARVSEAEERALADITNAEAQRGQLAQELAAARTEFKRYQALKTVEVKLLEQRLLHLMQAGGSGGPSSGTAGAAGGGKGKQQQAVTVGAATPPLLAQQQVAVPGTLDAEGGLVAITAVSEIAAVCSSDGIAAALREANLERMQREQVEREAAGAREAAEALRSRLKAAEVELAGLKGRQGGEVRAVRERAERLQAELAECQAALRQAKADSGRRLKELQALQKQASMAEGSGGGAATEAALEQERRARETAEAQLKEAKGTLARKTAMVKELRSKVSELEQALVMSGSAPLQVELETCQARLKALQASCGSKEATIKELRQRLEEQVRLATEQGTQAAQEERQRGREAAQALKAELANREAQVASLREELEQVHKELAAATASMRIVEAERQAMLEGTGRQLVRSMQHAQQLSQAVHELLALVGALAGAAASGAAAYSAHTHVAAAAGLMQGGNAGGAAAAAAASPAGLAQQLSSYVDLPAEDIESLLLPAGRNSGGADGGGAAQGGRESAEEQLPQLVQEAGRLVERLHAAYDSGMPADNAMLASLGTILAVLKQQCLRARDSLDSAVAQLQHQSQQAPLPSSLGFRGQESGLGVGGEQAPSRHSSTADAVSYLEEQLRRAAQEIGEIEGRLL